MTTVELAQRLIFRSTHDDLTSLDQGSLLAFADVINRSIQQWFSLCPEAYRQTTGSALLEAVETVAVTATNGSTSLAGTPFTAAHRGKTVVIGDDSQQNEITGLDSLLHAYRGTTGAQSSLVYSDVITFTDYSVERVNTDPVVLDTGLELINTASMRSGAFRGVGTGIRIGKDRDIDDHPRYYKVDHVGASRADDVLFMLRLDPIPTVETTIQFDFTIRPAVVSWQNVKDTPLALPLDDTLIYGQLLPIAEGMLAKTQLWGEGAEAAAMAMGDMGMALSSVTALPDTFAPPNRRIRTKPGY